MKGRGVAGALALAAVALFGPAMAGQTLPPGQAPPPIFRADADVVSVDASVQREGRPVTGLKAGDFEILDNGVPQEIAEVAYERLPVDVTMVLDVSASVTGPALDELRKAVRQVRADLGGGDRLRLLAFNMRIRRLVDFEPPASDLGSALAPLRGEGSSAVFDGLAVALAGADAPGRRRLVVLFTDGQDSSSISDPDVLFDVARRTSSTVNIVLASTAPERSSASPFARPPGGPPITVGRMYDQLARETGGVVVPMTRGEDLVSTFRRTLSDFRASYVLYYTPQGVARDGSHTINVRVKQDGTEVRARRGYIWK